VGATAFGRSRFELHALLATPSVLFQESLQWWIRDFTCVVRDGRGCDHRHYFEQVLSFKTGLQKSVYVVVGQLTPVLDELLRHLGKGRVPLLLR
jgi:hypothetical protein